MVVQASVRVVVVSQFWKIAYSLMCLLENGNADSHIVGRSYVLSILVFEVFFLDVPEQFGVECSEVACYKRVSAVRVIDDGPCGERP